MAYLNYDEIVSGMRNSQLRNNTREAAAPSSINMSDMFEQCRNSTTFPTIDEIANGTEGSQGIDRTTYTNNQAISRLNRYLNEAINSSLDGALDNAHEHIIDEFRRQSQSHNLCQEIPDPSITNRVVDTMFLEAVHMVDYDKKYIDGNITFNPQTNKLVVYDAQGDTFVEIAIETDAYKNPVGVTIDGRGIDLKEFQQDKTTNLIDENIYDSSEPDDLKKLI